MTRLLGGWVLTVVLASGCLGSREDGESGEWSGDEGTGAEAGHHVTPPEVCEDFTVADRRFVLFPTEALSHESFACPPGAEELRVLGEAAVVCVSDETLELSEVEAIVSNHLASMTVAATGPRIARAMDVIFVLARDEWDDEVDLRWDLPRWTTAIVRHLLDRGLDVRVAVLTTDLLETMGWARTSSGEYSQCCYAQDHSTVRSCHTGPDGIITFDSDAQANDPSANQYAMDALECASEVGLTGSRADRGLEASRRFLTRDPALQRTGARLGLVFISNDSDCSVPVEEAFDWENQAYGSGAECTDPATWVPVSDYVDFVTGLSAYRGDVVAVSVTGPDDGARPGSSAPTCRRDDGYVAYNGYRYQQFAAALEGGPNVDLCSVSEDDLTSIAAALLRPRPGVSACDEVRWLLTGGDSGLQR